MNDSASLEPFENATSTEDVPSEEPPSIDPAPTAGDDYDGNHTSLAPPDTPGQATWHTNTTALSNHTNKLYTTAALNV